MPLGYSRDSPQFVVGAVSGAHFLSHFYLLVFPPLFPLLKAEFGVSNTQLGLLVSLLYLLPSILQVPVGELVDRTGAKRILVLGVTVTALGIMATTLADTYLSLLGLALLAGVGQSAFHPADFALLESVTDEANRGKGFGTHTFAGFLGFAAGPIVTGTLGLRYGWRTALASLAVVGLAYAVTFQLLVEPVHLERRSDEEADESDDSRTILTLLSDPRLLGTFAFFILLTVASTGIQSFTVVFLTNVSELGTAAANTTLTANLTTTAFGVLAGGVLADRYSIYATLVATLVAAGVLVGVVVTGVALYAFAPALVVFAALGLFHGLALPSRDSLVSKFSTSDSTGKSFGFAYTGVTVGAFVAPVLFGFVSDAVNVRFMYALVSVFYVGAVLTIVALYFGVGTSTPDAGRDEEPQGSR